MSLRRWNGCGFLKKLDSFLLVKLIGLSKTGHEFEIDGKENETRLGYVVSNGWCNNKKSRRDDGFFIGIQFWIIVEQLSQELRYEL